MSATPEQRACLHRVFGSEVVFARLGDSMETPAEGYRLSLRVRCHECGLPFRFLGLPFGVSDTIATLSVDSLELRAPLEPEILPELMGRPESFGRA